MNIDHKPEGVGMKVSAIKQAIFKGAEERCAYPLTRGLYRLRQAHERHWRIGDEVERIIAIKRGQLPDYYLRHCTYDEIGAWLRDIPVSLAYDLSYELKAGFWALEADGVSKAALDDAYRGLLPLIKNVEEVLEFGHEFLKSRLEREFQMMEQSGMSRAQRTVWWVEDLGAEILEFAEKQLPDKFT
jgi:hypothetical protein